MVDIPTDYKVILEKEYYKLDRNKPTIGLLMMVKNEQKRLHVSLNSVIGQVDALIMFDTGSTDNTLDIIKTFSETHKINLYLIQGEFINFSISRNTSLHYADTIGVHYLLLLDCNDELKGKGLRVLAKDFYQKPTNAFLLCQEWFTGVSDKYYNIRLVKNRCGWRYRGSVHEWMKDTNREGPDPVHPVVRIPDEMDIVLYQDRTQDDDKTGKRFHRDRELLLKDHADNPTDTRTLFYLSQTCECLGKQDEAFYYAKLRLEQEGFEEERFHSYIRCANSCLILEHSWEDALGWYMKAYEHSVRAEAIVKIADYYRFQALLQDKEENAKEARSEKGTYHRKTTHAWRIAYMFAHEACDLPYPSHCVLFVDKGIYDYYRWHLMGIIGFYVGKYEEGKAAALKALSSGINKVENEKILKFYLDKEKEDVKHVQDTQKGKPNAIETRKQYIDRITIELQQKFPTLPQAQLQRRATAMWKKL